MAQEDKSKEKVVTIIVNGREKPVTEKELTYEQVVRLAFDTPPTGPNVEITVTYRKAHGNKEGTMVSGGEPVKVKEGMIFNVTATDKS